MEECFEEWLNQFKKLESWHEELMEGDFVYMLWESFQAGWEAHTNEVDKKIRIVREMLKRGENENI